MTEKQSNTKEKNMLNLNKCTFAGNLGSDPELKYSSNGTAICKFAIATSHSIKKDNEWNEKTEWHNIVVFGAAAENCSKRLKKGSNVYVESKMQSQAYTDKDGKEIKRIVFIANEIKFIDKFEKTEKSETSTNSISATIPDEDIPF